MTETNIKMKYDPEKHHRRSIRLKEYDYSQSGAYFITICVYNRECLFGEIVNGEVRLNEWGTIVEKELLKTPALRSNVLLDEYVVMPNHLHGIIVIMDHCRGVLQYAPTRRLRSPSQTIGAIVRGFKSATTKRINEMRAAPGMPVWQRNYYEHIIRNENELNEIREYIVGNPIKWAEDENNPVNLT
jgi:REP element-mobilizing transposase RayT